MSEAQQSEEYQAALNACRKALEAIAPCVVGWPEGQMPSWAERLIEVVPDLQAVLGVTPNSPPQHG